MGGKINLALVGKPYALWLLDHRPSRPETPTMGVESRHEKNSWMIMGLRCIFVWLRKLISEVSLALACEWL